MTEDEIIKGTKKPVQGLTHDPIDTDDTFVIDDATHPIAFDDTPQDEARRKTDHNTISLAHSPQELGSEPETNRPKVQPGTTKIAKARSANLT